MQTKLYGLRAEIKIFTYEKKPWKICTNLPRVRIIPIAQPSEAYLIHYARIFIFVFFFPTNKKMKTKTFNVQDQLKCA